MKCEQTMTTDQAGNQRTKKTTKKNEFTYKQCTLLWETGQSASLWFYDVLLQSHAKSKGFHYKILSLWKAKQLNIMMWGAATEPTPRMGCKNIFMSCCITQGGKWSSFAQFLLCFNHLFSFIWCNFNVTFHLSSNRTVSHQMSTEAFHKVFCDFCDNAKH